MCALVGGALYLIGFVDDGLEPRQDRALAGKAVDGEVDGDVEERKAVLAPTCGGLARHPSGLPAGAGRGGRLTFFLGGASLTTAIAVLVGLVRHRRGAWLYFKARPGSPDQPTWHALVEGKPLLFTVLLLVAVLIGGIAQILPTIFAPSAVPCDRRGPEALLAARARGPRHLHPRGLLPLPLADDPDAPAETQRYGAYSRPEESIYDHPFQWGSKRNRARPGTGRRQVPQHLALRAPDRPARHQSRQQHAELRLDGRLQGGRVDDAPEDDCHAEAGRALQQPRGGCRAGDVPTAGRRHRR